MTTTTDLYHAAVADWQARGGVYSGGTATHTLSNGDTIFCMVDAVAGRSIVSKHRRTTYGIKAAGEHYAKPISRAKVVALLASTEVDLDLARAEQAEAKP